MTPTTDLQKLLAEATSGPWCQPDGEEYGVSQENLPRRPIHSFLGQPFYDKQPHDDWFAQEMANARLIAMAPDLAARILALEAENKRLREGLTKIGALHPEATELSVRIGKIIRAALKGGEI
jgi:hypothetical protein